jgi:SRSO17 transposase
MQSEAVAALDGRLRAFLEPMLGFLGREERRRWARAYVAGLLLDGERKSILPLAGRLGLDGDPTQALQQFVSTSPWSCERLQGAMGQAAARLWPHPHAWIIDETGFPKAGNHSVGVAHQYCGALGKIANCQVAVSLHYAAGGTAEHAASAALGWRLLLPRQWCDDPLRRQKAGVPAEVTYRSKNTLALELIEEALGRGLPAAPVLADSDYGDDYGWRTRLRQMGVGYCVAVQPRAKAWTTAPVGSPPPAAGRPVPKDLLPTPKRLDQIARALPAGAWRHVTWREGTRGPMRGRFARVAVWTSHGYTQRQHGGQRSREWLFIEWPAGSETPSDYWLADLGARTNPPTLARLAALARERWRVEQDYRELKEELGLDHFEGRSWRGWHHHVTLVSLAHLFLQSERLEPVEATQKKPAASTRRTRKPAANSSSAARRARAHVLHPLPLV